MIYYLMFIISGVLIDFKDLRNSDKKTDVIFYVGSMLIAVALGVFYYMDTNRMGIAGYLLKLFKEAGI